MPIQRTAYFSQTATVGGTKLAVSSANIEISRPIEAVTAFGKFGSLNTAQTNITTCKSSVKCYVGNDLDGGFLAGLVESTKLGKQIGVSVNPGGFSMEGILTSIGIDISVGGFAMADLGFAGVGQPGFTPAAAETAGDDTLTILPVTTLSIDLPGVTPTSLKFSYDLPTDVLGALGENPNADQGSLLSRIASKAPYKATMTFEGYGDLPANSLDAEVANVEYKIGSIGIKFKNGKVTAKTFNNAAGQASAVFSYTIEDVAAELTSVALGDYVQNQLLRGSATWGAGTPNT